VSTPISAASTTSCACSTPRATRGRSSSTKGSGTNSPASCATTATKTCSVTGNLKSDTALALTANNVNTGWICESYEKVYEVGKYATYSAEFSFYPTP
jgi:hypothetical protein